MHSSTSSSDRRYLVAFALTFLALVGAWELVLRSRAGATIEFALQRPKMEVTQGTGETWVVFGNCLVMTGISPKLLGDELGAGNRTIFNIAAHEQSPIAFFEYLRRNKQYPDVVVANVSSWINGTNFEQEADLVMQSDPLSLATATRAQAKPNTQSYRESGATTGEIQQAVETAIARVVNENVQALGHRYHLFDYLIFLGTLATTANLDGALYQLQIQSWFKVTHSETDGFGYLGVHVSYRGDWPDGLDKMAERYLKRMRFSRLLTERYWSLLEENVRDMQQHGTRVVFVRMPEHPAIRAFNNETYDLPKKLDDLAARLGTPVLDLSTLGPADGVHLFDSVHPDADAATVITKRIAAWLRERKLTARALE